MNALGDKLVQLYGSVDVPTNAKPYEIHGRVIVVNKASDVAENDWEIDLEEAEKFLKQLDPDTEEFTYQTFDDWGEKRLELTQILHGTLKQHADALTELNEQGAGIFVTINKTDQRGRKAENVIKLRKFFVDTDGAPINPIIKAARAAEMEPSCVVESSPDKFHVYWDADCGLEQFKPIQTALANRFGTDKSVNDLSRVLRVPGFYHQKCKNDRYVNACEVFRVRIIKVWDNPVSYTPEQMIQGLGLDITRPAPARIAANDVTNTILRPSPPPETPEQIVRVRSMLAAIPADCARDVWLKIIWAVADTDWECAEELAREWSLTAPDKYNENDFTRDWKSFNPSHGIRHSAQSNRGAENDGA